MLYRMKVLAETIDAKSRTFQARGTIGELSPHEAERLAEHLEAIGARLDLEDVLEDIQLQCKGHLPGIRCVEPHGQDPVRVGAEELPGVLRAFDLVLDPAEGLREIEAAPVTVGSATPVLLGQLQLTDAGEVAKPVALAQEVAHHHRVVRRYSRVRRP